MHAKWKTAETRAETAERQAAELQAQIAGNVREQAPQSETEAREAFNRRHLEAAKDHPQRMAAARQKYADFDQSLKTVSVPMAVFPMIRELPNGPEVAYYLAKHPEDAQSLAKLSGVEMFRRIDRLSGALEHEQTQRERNAARERNKPPAPISTVGASSSRTSIPLDELPVGEYIRRRNKQERERR
jgi:hypothetical protein